MVALSSDWSLLNSRERSSTTCGSCRHRLRPEELFALERRDLDLEEDVLRVERVYTQGVLKDCRKSSR
jgi:hypothetical protein